MSIHNVQGRARETTEAKRVAADYGSHMLGLEDPKRKHVKNGSFREWEKGGPGDGGMKPEYTHERGPGRSAP